MRSTIMRAREKYFYIRLSNNQKKMVGWCQSAIGCLFLLLDNVCIFYSCEDLKLLFCLVPQTKKKIIRGNLFPLIIIIRAGWWE